MSKADERRAAILDLLAEFVLSEGLSASSLRPLARAAQLSDRMLLYYFRDKGEVIAATLERISQKLVELMSERTSSTPLPLDELRPKLLQIALDDEFWPYMCLWLEIAALAARNDPLYREVGERIGHGFYTWVKAQLSSKTPEEHDREAALLFATIEGSVLLKAVGMEGAFRHSR